MLTLFAWLSLILAFICALYIVADEIKRSQKMAIMNVVWPISAFYFSILAVWAYRSWCLQKTRAAMSAMEHRSQGNEQRSESSSPTRA